MPTFTWNSVSEASTYLIEIATDAGFSNIVDSQAGLENPAYTPASSLSETTLHYWRVTASNLCGSGSTSAVYSFTTKAIPPILLVDDDDNAPDVRSSFTDALDVLGEDYDIWDTANSDNEPGADYLSDYDVVIWFSGDAFDNIDGVAGPGSAGETALATWLDAGACLLVSSQDYHYDRGGITSFMSNYLGASAMTDDTGDYSSVSGQNVFASLGTVSLSYGSITDYLDILSATGSAQLAMDGNNGNGAAVSKDSGTYRTSFWAFPLPALSTATARQDALSTFLTWCDGLSEPTPTPTATMTQTPIPTPTATQTPTATATVPGPIPTPTDTALPEVPWIFLPITIREP